MAKKVINLALQGGGSHGAFTWGVLDRILQEDIKIEGVSGASAGAINAAALAAGLCAGGNEGGREAMDNFWLTLSEISGALNPFHFVSDYYGANALQYLPLNLSTDILSLIFSPYQTNPLNLDPLKEVIRRTVDIEVITKSPSIKLFVTATNLQTNRLKIFENKDISEEALLASASLPNIHHAVKYEGEYYWDGGFMGNPILEPLIYNCESKDMFIIQINPTLMETYPFTSREIQERLNEIVFNSSLMREIRNIVHIQHMLEGKLPDNPYMQIHLHSIRREDYMKQRGTHSKYDTSWRNLLELKEAGNNAAEDWLKTNWNHIGKKTTMDLTEWKMTTPGTTCIEEM